MKSIKEMYYKFTDVLNYKNQIKILRKQVEELKKEPQQLIDKIKADLDLNKVKSAVVEKVTKKKAE